MIFYIDYLAKWPCNITFFVYADGVKARTLSAPLGGDMLKNLGCIQRIVSRWAMQFPEWRNIKELSVCEFNLYHSVGYARKSLFNGNTFYVLFIILYPPAWVDEEPTILSIREFTTKGRCDLAYMAITEP